MSEILMSIVTFTGFFVLIGGLSLIGVMIWWKVAEHLFNTQKLLRFLIKYNKEWKEFGKFWKKKETKKP